MYHLIYSIYDSDVKIKNTEDHVHGVEAVNDTSCGVTRVCCWDCVDVCVYIEILF